MLSDYQPQLDQPKSASFRRGIQIHFFSGYPSSSWNRFSSLVLQFLLVSCSESFLFGVVLTRELTTSLSDFPDKIAITSSRKLMMKSLKVSTIPSATSSSSGVFPAKRNFLARYLAMAVDCENGTLSIYRMGTWPVGRPESLRSNQTSPEHNYSVSTPKTLPHPICDLRMEHLTDGIVDGTLRRVHDCWNTSVCSGAFRRKELTIREQKMRVICSRNSQLSHFAVLKTNKSSLSKQIILVFQCWR